MSHVERAGPQSNDRTNPLSVAERVVGASRWDAIMRAAGKAKPRLFATLAVALAFASLEALLVPKGFYSGRIALFPILVSETLWHLLRLVWVGIIAQAALACGDVLGASLSAKGRAALHVLVLAVLAWYWASLSSAGSRVILIVAAGSALLLLTAIASVFLRSTRFASWERLGALLALAALGLVYYWNLTRYSTRYLGASATILSIVIYAGTGAITTCLEPWKRRVNVGVLCLVTLATLSLSKLSAAGPSSFVGRASRGLTSIGRAATRLHHRDALVRSDAQSKLPEREHCRPKRKLPFFSYLGCPRSPRRRSRGGTCCWSRSKRRASIARRSAPTVV